MAETEVKRVRVVVGPHAQLYLPGGIHPFREGDALELDEAQAKLLIAAGTIRLDMPPPPAPVEPAAVAAAEPAPVAELAPAPEPEPPAQ